VDDYTENPDQRKDVAAEKFVSAADRHWRHIHQLGSSAARSNGNSVDAAEYKAIRKRLGLEAPFLQRMVLRQLMRGRDLKQAEIDRLRALDVKPLAMAKVFPMQAHRVQFDGELFAFADDDRDCGEMAFTIGVVNENGLVDAAAWQPATGRLAIWLGEGFALGEHLIQNHVDDDSSGLAVFRSPLDWMRANCRGIVILQNRFAPVMLAPVRVLLAEDEHHRDELRNIFPAGSAAPHILVRANPNEPELAA
jgi:hypothetical protein